MRDDDILFRRIKDIALKFDQSPSYQRWLRDRVGSKDIHHCCASVHGRKSTNLLAVGVPHIEHIENQDNRDWLIEKLPEGIQNLIEYALHLESRTGINYEEKYDEAMDKLQRCHARIVSFETHLDKKSKLQTEVRAFLKKEKNPNEKES